MKNFKILFCAICAATCLSSCDFNLEKEPEVPPHGYLSLQFSGSLPQSKAYGEIPDTSEFQISIVSTGGQCIFHGYYYDLPQNMELAPGLYTVSAVSCEFSEPIFDCPQYGYTTEVEIVADQTSCVILDCAQTNAGVRLLFDPDFRSNYPSAQVYVSSSRGKLLYGYNEKRIAYFSPGNINISIYEGNSGTSIANRTVKAQELLILKLYSKEYISQASGLEFQLDTAVSRAYEELRWGLSGWQSSGGGSSSGGSSSSVAAISVQQVAGHIGEKGVWVSGFIAGLSKSSSSSEFESPFSSNTNLLLSPTVNNTDRETCIAVELAKGEIRDALNLKDHPGYLNRKIKLKGNVEESYFGLTGLKKISDFEWE